MQGVLKLDGSHFDERKIFVALGLSNSDAVLAEAESVSKEYRDRERQRQRYIEEKR